jgi:hypothetical protein
LMCGQLKLPSVPQYCRTATSESRDRVVGFKLQKAATLGIIRRLQVHAGQNRGGRFNDFPGTL